MSGSINKVIIVGNLGDDVKMHHFDDQNCIGRFPVATSETYTLRDSGERVSQTEWHNIVSRNKLAKLCEKYLSKGDKVYVEGKIKTRKWDDNGQTRYQTEIIADTIQFLSTRRDGSSSTHDSSASESNNNSSSSNTGPQVSTQPPQEDDLPF